MAQSTFVTRQFASDAFVESCGAVLFHVDDDHDHHHATRVCLVKLRSTGEWLLPKGRRNISESRRDAAVREIVEETGFPCQLFPVRMPTRACAPAAPADAPDVASVYDGIVEPFMCTVRELPLGKGIKIIWWYVGKLGDCSGTDHGLHPCGPGEPAFQAEFFPCDEAVRRLHFEQDREVLRRAVSIVEDSIGGRQESMCSQG